VCVGLGSGHHNCALTTDYTVMCWGANNFGQLGFGHTNHPYTTPTVNTALGTSVMRLVAGGGCLFPRLAPPCPTRRLPAVLLAHSLNAAYLGLQTVVTCTCTCVCGQARKWGRSCATAHPAA